MKILIVVGSLRAASFSRKLALAAASMAPQGVETELVDGRDLPLYDQDLDGEEKPASVRVLLDHISAADGLLFVSPEFNYGIPGTLKNLIDWASRPAYNSPLKDTPALIIAHSVAPSGGARAHSQLGTVLAGTLSPVFVGPGFLIPGVHEKFDGAGALTDEATRHRLTVTFQQFVEWVARLVTG
ncbi:MAG: NADPH-dependent FMN reductase [Myxococcota bacterium]|nr:NADPH-dependent FMN reductase [Myxococcota bacterium]